MTQRSGSTPNGRKIPGAAVARLPLYYRALLEVAEDDLDYAGGRFTVKGTDKSLAVTDAALAAWTAHDLPDGTEPGLEALHVYDPPNFSWPGGCHIAVVGIEKIVPTDRDLAVLLNLLARSGTGQQLTVYTEFLSGPRRGAQPDGPDEMHVVFVDNGSIYTSKEITQICVRLGTLLCHAPVRDGAAKGKVERFFRTVRESFAKSKRTAPLSSLVVWRDRLIEPRLHTAVSLPDVTSRISVHRLERCTVRPGRAVWLHARLLLSLNVIQPLPVCARVRIMRA